MKPFRISTIFLLFSLWYHPVFSQSDSLANQLTGRWMMQKMGMFEASIQHTDSLLQNPALNKNTQRALRWDLNHLKEKYRLLLDSSFIEFMPNHSFVSLLTPDSYHDLEKHSGNWNLDTNNDRKIDLQMKGYSLSLFIDSIGKNLLRLRTDLTDPRKYWDLRKQ